MITTKEKAIEVLERADDYVGIHYINGVENSYINPALKEAISFAIAALRPVSREKVEKVLRGKWAFKSFYKGTSRGAIECQKCKSAFEGSVGFNFCPHCGAPMTDEAVDILLKRLEALKDAGD